MVMSDQKDDVRLKLLLHAVLDNADVSGSD